MRHIIAEANAEDASNEDGGCNDGQSVEENIRRRLQAEHFTFIVASDTRPWDIHETTNTAKASKS